MVSGVRAFKCDEVGGLLSPEWDWDSCGRGITQHFLTCWTHLESHALWPGIFKQSSPICTTTWDFKQYLSRHGHHGHGLLPSRTMRNVFLCLANYPHLSYSVIATETNQNREFQQTPSSSKWLQLQQCMLFRDGAIIRNEERRKIRTCSIPNGTKEVWQLSVHCS